MMPLLFLGHGNPMNAIRESIFVDEFKKISQQIEKPKSILCISAHWYIKGTKVTAMPSPKTIHDFGGFPLELYQVQYPAPGNPELAEQVISLNPEFPIERDYEWGLDHGTWSVIKHFYPQADIPVIQLSIDYTNPASYHFKLGKSLLALRNQGVLIVGSGNIVHNLREVDYDNMDEIDYGYPWATEAYNELNDLIINKKYEKLVDYKNLSQAVQRAIPIPDHFLPLLYILSLQQDNEKVTLFNDHLVGGSLSMTSLIIS
jgi:4,5-DOPA dioxygenase extradiol